MTTTKNEQNKTKTNRRKKYIYIGVLTEAFTLICSPIDEYFGTDYITKGEEHLH